MLEGNDTTKCDFNTGTLDSDDSAEILPNSVHLIKTTMLPNRSSNWNQLSGLHLFCQIYSRDDDKQFCLLCRNYHNSLSELKQHYQSFHDLAVLTSKTEHDKSTYYECTGNTNFDYPSAYCMATFPSLVHLADHYLRWHGGAGTALLEYGATLLKKCFYCGLCGEYSDSFRQCLGHMEDRHGMKTFVCSYCVYCNPVSGFVRIHELQMHEQHYPEALVRCSVCLRYARGEEGLTKHVMKDHVVETGPNYWSCATCLRTFNCPLELMEHLKTCSKHRPGDEATFNPTPGRKKRIVFTCDTCPLVFASEEEFEKHEDQESHIVGSPEKMIRSSINTDDTRKCDPSVFDLNTCFLCCMRFASVETHWKHQHHVHMQWVTKGVAYPGQQHGNESTQHLQELESSSVLEREHIPENYLEPVIEYVLENDIPSFTNFVEQQLAQVSEHTIATETDYDDEEVTIQELPVCVSNPPEEPSEDLDIAEVNNNNGMNLNKEIVEGSWEVCKVQLIQRSEQTFAANTKDGEEVGTIQEQPGSNISEKPSKAMDLDVAEIDNNNGMNLNKEIVEGNWEVCKVQLVRRSEQTTAASTNHGEAVGTMQKQPGTNISEKPPEAMDLDMAGVNNNNGTNLNKEIVKESWEVCKVELVRRSEQTIAANTNVGEEVGTIQEQPGSNIFEKPSKAIDLDVAEIDNNNRMNLNKEIAEGSWEVCKVELVRKSEKTPAANTNHGEEVCTIQKQPGSNISEKLSEAIDLDMAGVNNNSGMNPNKEIIVESRETSKINRCLAIAQDGFQIENELADIGYPSKFGHYCHLCDKVIENYWFYYLHMRNFHRLEKRFKCVVTACGRIFTGIVAFQDHAFKVHNQKSRHNCRLCDVVFGNKVEERNHYKCSYHRDNVKRLATDHDRMYPRNHKCSICHCWLGLFSIFVEHMENNEHIYIKNAD